MRSESLSTVIEQAKTLQLWLHERTNGRPLVISERSVTGVALLQHALDIVDAIIVLLENELPGPAWALSRPLFESYIRGVWILNCATESEIAGFLKDDPPRLDQLIQSVNELDSTRSAWMKVTRVNIQTFHSFVHGGSEHVWRRIGENSLEPNYPERELKYLVGIAIEVCLRCGYELFSLWRDDRAMNDFMIEIQKLNRFPIDEVT